MVMIDISTGKLVDSMRHGNVAVLTDNTWEEWGDYLYPDRDWYCEDCERNVLSCECHDYD